MSLPSATSVMTRLRQPTFGVWLGAIAVLALVVRVVTVMAHYRNLPLGLDDNAWYNIQSRLLAQEGGFYEPFVYKDTCELGDCQLVDSAGHPPLYIVYLAGYSLIGLDSALANRLASSLLGVATVVVIGLAARYVARWSGATAWADRAGLAAALIAAVYPNLWINDGLILSESLYTVFMGLLILAAYWYWVDPTPRRAALVGLVIALAALTRSEGATFLLFLGAPLTLFAVGGAWKRRLTHAVVLGVTALAVMGPWIAFNLARFEEPEFLAAGGGRVLAHGNCETTFHGELLGYWDPTCDIGDFAANFDEFEESEIDVAHREQATEFIGDNLSRVPVVAAARVGRIWEFFRPNQGLAFNRFFERRGEWPGYFGLAAWYALIPLAITGAVVLHRRGTTLVPLLAPFVLVSLTSALAFGITRYRATAEVAFVVLAGLALGWLSKRSTRSTAQDGARAPAADAA